MSSVVSTKPTAGEYVEFYSTLFSHEDRPSNSSLESIANEVKEYADADWRRVVLGSLKTK